MVSDIEHLKRNKIPPPKKRLPQVRGEPGPASEPPQAGPMEVVSQGTAAAEPVATDALEPRIVAALKTVHDPEIPVNIYDLGLIYGMTIDGAGEVEVEMTLTAPACPVAGALVKEVADKAASVPGVVRSKVKLVWDPPWSQDRMTEEARLELGLL